MKMSRNFAVASMMIAGLALTGCGNETGSTSSTTLERPTDHALGNADASITMIEYASVACGTCARFHSEIWPMIESEFIETGKVQFVFRESIAGPSSIAVAGMALARCVPDDKFFDAVDLLFTQQRAIMQAAAQPGGAMNQYNAIGNTLGLSTSELSECLNSQDMINAILETHRESEADGVRGTPVFFINGRRLDKKRASGDSLETYFLDDQQILIDGESVTALFNADTFRRVLNHVLDQMEQVAG